MGAVGIALVFLDHLQQHVGAEDIIAHGCIDATRVLRHGGGIGFLLMKADDTPAIRRLDHAEVSGELFIRGQRGNRDMGVFPFMILDHLADVHAIDVIRAEDNDDVGCGLLDEVERLPF